MDRRCNDSVASGNPLERRSVGIALVWCGRGVDRFRSALDRSTFAGPSRPSAGIAHAGTLRGYGEIQADLSVECRPRNRIAE